MEDWISHLLHTHTHTHTYHTHISSLKALTHKVWHSLLPKPRGVSLAWWMLFQMAALLNASSLFSDSAAWLQFLSNLPASLLQSSEIISFLFIHEKSKVSDRILSSGLNLRSIVMSFSAKWNVWWSQGTFFRVLWIQQISENVWTWRLENKFLFKFLKNPHPLLWNIPAHVFWWETSVGGKRSRELNWYFSQSLAAAKRNRYFFCENISLSNENNVLVLPRIFYSTSDEASCNSASPGISHTVTCDSCCPEQPQIPLKRERGHLKRMEIGYD